MAPTEGLIFVSFNFDGRRHTSSHTLSVYEVKQLKEHLTAVGEAACASVVSKTAIQNTAILAENVLAKAFLAFIKKYHKVNPPTMEDAIDILRKELKESNDESH